MNEQQLTNSALKSEAERVAGLYYAGDTAAFKSETAKLMAAHGATAVKAAIADVKAEREAMIAKAAEEAEAAKAKALEEKRKQDESRFEKLKAQSENALKLGLTVPTVNPDWIKTESFDVLCEYGKSAGEFPLGIMLTGPHGTGKTETAQQFAAHLGLPFHKVSVPLYRDSLAMLGRYEAENATTVWHPSMLAKAIASGGLVLLLDEINRANPMVTNSLLGLLDNTRAVFIEETNHVLQRAPGIFILATANVGAKYSGTTRLDSAQADRFEIKFETNYLSKDNETDLLVRKGLDKVVASQLCEFASRVRASYLAGELSEPVTTRQLIGTAEIYRALEQKSVAQAINLTVINTFVNDPKLGANSERAKVLQMVQACVQ